VTTSKLEDQYPKHFNLAVWREEPPAMICFFETCWILYVFQKNC